MRTWKKITAAAYQTILSSGIVTERTKYICKYCLNHVTRRTKENVRDNPILEITDSDDETGTCDRFIDLTIELQRIISPDITALYNQRKLKGCVCYIFASLSLSLNEGTCQAKKNVFYFSGKALFVLEKIKF